MAKGAFRKATRRYAWAQAPPTALGPSDKMNYAVNSATVDDRLLPRPGDTHQ
jgi:hypothetical protein